MQILFIGSDLDATQHVQGLDGSGVSRALVALSNAFKTLSLCLTTITVAGG